MGTRPLCGVADRADGHRLAGECPRQRGLGRRVQPRAVGGRLCRDVMGADPDDALVVRAGPAPGHRCRKPGDEVAADLAHLLCLHLH